MFSEMNKIVNSIKYRKLILMSTISKTFTHSLEKSNKKHN